MTTHNILIQVKSQEEAERIIHLFRSLPLTVRAHRVTSKEDLEEHLDEGIWDLLISDNLHPNISLAYSLEIRQQKQPEMPVILLAANQAPEAENRLVKLGITDIIHPDKDGLFLHAAQREIRHFNLHREVDHLTHSRQELSKRLDTLLSDTRESIAYLAEGILISCNQSFAQLLGFDSTDDLECAAFIDLVDDKDTCKQLFKTLGRKQDALTSKLTFNRKGDTPVLLDVSLKNAFMDGESCIQINLKHNHGVSMETGKIQATPAELLLAEKDRLTIQAGTHCFSLLAINDFDMVREEFSYSGCLAVLADLKQQILNRNNDLTVIPLNENTLAFFPEGSCEQGLDLCESIVHRIDKHIFEHEQTSLCYNVSACVFELSSQDFPLFLDHAFSALLDKRKDNKSKAVIIPLDLPHVAKDNHSGEAAENLTISHDTIELLYQPLMSLLSDETHNYEVTCKEKNEQQTLTNREDTALDRWVIIESTKTLSAHRKKSHKTRLLVNLSANSLKDEGFANWIKVVLKASNLPKDSIIFQFDEKDILANLKQAVDTCQALQQNGHLLSFRNFRSNDKSLKIFTHLKPQFVHFGSDVTASLEDPDKFETVKTCLEKLSEMTIKSLLSNVNNASELASIWQLGVNYITGSYIQEPSGKMNFEFEQMH